MLMVCVALLWVKTFATLRFTSLLGPIIGIAIRMVSDVISYAILFIAFMLVMALVGSLLL